MLPVAMKTENLSAAKHRLLRGVVIEHHPHQGNGREHDAPEAVHCALFRLANFARNSAFREGAPDLSLNQALVSTVHTGAHATTPLGSSPGGAGEAAAQGAGSAVRAVAPDRAGRGDLPRSPRRAHGGADRGGSRSAVPVTDVRSTTPVRATRGEGASYCATASLG